MDREERGRRERGKREGERERGGERWNKERVKVSQSQRGVERVRERREGRKRRRGGSLSDTRNTPLKHSPMMKAFRKFEYEH